MEFCNRTVMQYCMQKQDAIRIRLLSKRREVVSLDSHVTSGRYKCYVNPFSL